MSSSLNTKSNLQANKTSDWVFVFIVCLLIPLSGFATDVYAPSLPAISQDLGVSSHWVRMSMTIFVFGFACGQIIFGTLSDHLGRKIIIWPMLVVFILASCVAASVHNITVLLCMRCIQGLAAASPSAVCKAIINDRFTGAKHHHVFALLAAFWGLGPVLGPYVGGILQHHYNWPSTFVFLAVFGALCLAVVMFMLPETLPRRSPLQFSVTAQRFKLILSCRRYWSGTISNAIMYLYILGFNIIGPYLIQDAWHYTAVFYGYMALLMGVAWMTGSTLSRYLQARTSVSNILLGSSIALILTTIVNFIISMLFEGSIWTLIPPIMLLVFCGGIIFPIVMGNIMASFDPALGGAVSSLLGTGTFGFSAIGAACFSMIHPHSQLPLAWAVLIMTLINTVAVYVFWHSCLKNKR